MNLVNFEITRKLVDLDNVTKLIKLVEFENPVGIRFGNDWHIEKPVGKPEVRVNRDSCNLIMIDRIDIWLTSDDVILKMRKIYPNLKMRWNRDSCNLIMIDRIEKWLTSDDVIGKPEVNVLENLFKSQNALESPLYRLLVRASVSAWARTNPKFKPKPIPNPNLS